MDGLKEAIEYVVDLSPAKEYDMGYGIYTDKKLYRVEEPMVKPINTTSLESLIDYIHRNVDCLNLEDIFINIKSAQNVTLESKYNIDKQRDTYLSCTAHIPQISYSQFYDNEGFNILMQSSFQDTTDKSLILKVIGNLREEGVKSISDDGVSQAVAIKTGIASVENVKVPNPVSLKPYRTFSEVQQPESKFIFRMRDGGACALYEADGGAWQIQARKNIRDYIKQHLEELDLDIMIIG